MKFSLHTHPLLIITRKPQLGQCQTTYIWDMQTHAEELSSTLVYADCRRVEIVKRQDYCVGVQY